jgi:hypothetical protein
LDTEAREERHFIAREGLSLRGNLEGPIALMGRIPVIAFWAGIARISKLLAIFLFATLKFCHATTPLVKTEAYLKYCGMERRS